MQSMNETIIQWERAIEAVCIINPKVVFPMHQSNKDPDMFKGEVNSKSDSKAIILEVGEKAHV